MHQRCPRGGVSCWVVILFAALTSLGAPRANADAVETAGDVLQYGVPAVALASTAWLRDGKGAKQLVVTALVAETWVWTLKLAVDEKRPSGGGRGFPSGHSATAAFGAAFVHRRYGFWPSLPLYGLTGFVGWSRHDAGAHRPLDIVAGIAIGMGTAMVIATPYDDTISLTPMPLEDGAGVRLWLRF